ncbi:MAG TPA: hypothetical protein ENJ95_04820 [Bacteroidetes bacterium]|nr:hypothetical protein [Bacteroidota bacterium]
MTDNAKNIKPVHRIQKVAFDLEASSQQEAFAGQQKIKALFESCIAPALEKAMDEHCPNGTIYKLDKLHVDLGKIDTENINEKDLFLKFYNEIKKQLQYIHPGKIIKQTRQEGALDIFVYFIKNGHFPWQCEYVKTAELEAAILSENKTLPEYFSKLFQAENHRQRLANQFSTLFIENIVLNILKEKNKDWLEKEKRRLSVYFNKKNALLIILEAACKTTTKENFYLKTIAGHIDSNIGFYKKNKETKETRDAGFFKNKKENTNKDNGPKEEKEIYADHAGIVLLHPFLGRFFDNIELLENKVFKNEKSAETAVHLLYFLATGNTCPEEHELPVFKMMCNWPLKKPIAKEVLLPENYTAKSEALLRAAIGHWDKLKNTSIDGLREGFLQRKGKLEQQPEHWNLTVEHKTIDILMNSLPWSISIVKLPWMKKMLRVNWA